MLRRLLLHRRAVAAQREEQALEQSRHDAAALIVSANEKANQIIRDAHLFSRTIQHELAETLRTTSARVADDNQAYLQQLLAQADEQLASLLQRIAQELTSQSQAFSAQLHDRLQQLEQHLANEMSQEYRALLATMEEKKAAQLKALEQTVTDQVPALLRQALGRTLTPELHEQVVREALGEIQKQHQWPAHS